MPRKTERGRNAEQKEAFRRRFRSTDHSLALFRYFGAYLRVVRAVNPARPPYGYETTGPRLPAETIFIHPQSPVRRIGGREAVPFRHAFIDGTEGQQRSAVRRPPVAEILILHKGVSEHTRLFHVGRDRLYAIGRDRRRAGGIIFPVFPRQCKAEDFPFFQSVRNARSPRVGNGAYGFSLKIFYLRNSRIPLSAAAEYIRDPFCDGRLVDGVNGVIIQFPVRFQPARIDVVNRHRKDVFFRFLKPCQRLADIQIPVSVAVGIVFGRDMHRREGNISEPRPQLPEQHLQFPKIKPCKFEIERGAFSEIPHDPRKRNPLQRRDFFVPYPRKLCKVAQSRRVVRFHGIVSPHLFQKPDKLLVRLRRFMLQIRFDAQPAHGGVHRAHGQFFAFRHQRGRLHDQRGNPRDFFLLSRRPGIFAAKILQRQGGTGHLFGRKIRKFGQVEDRNFRFRRPPHPFAAILRRRERIGQVRLAQREIDVPEPYPRRDFFAARLRRQHKRALYVGYRVENDLKTPLPVRFRPLFGTDIPAAQDAFYRGGRRGIAPYGYGRVPLNDRPVPVITRKFHFNFSPFCRDNGRIHNTPTPIGPGSPTRQNPPR